MTNQTITKSTRFFQDIDRVKAIDKRIKKLRDELSLLSFMLHLRKVGTGIGIDKIESDITKKAIELYGVYFEKEQLYAEIKNTNNPFLRMA
jgi:hypothetical protein